MYLVDFIAAIGRWFVKGWKAFGGWRAARIAGDRDDAAGWLAEWLVRLGVGICFVILTLVAIGVDYYLSTR